MNLTAKQERFCQEYIIDLNATQAAIRSGYSRHTANEQAERMLVKVSIQRRITELMAERSERTQIDADYVLCQAVKLHERCMQEIRPFTDKKGNHIQDEDGNKLYVFDAPGAAKALEIVGKHINIQAFKERVDHTTNGKDLITPPKIIVVNPDGSQVELNDESV